MTRASRPQMTKKVPAETPYRMPMRLWSTVVNQLHRPRYAGSAMLGGATTMPPTCESGGRGAVTTAIRYSYRFSPEGTPRGCFPDGALVGQSCTPTHLSDCK